jgi:hypothetical protein
VKKLLLAAVLALGWFAAPIAPAQAQTPANCGVNFVPVVGVQCANVRQITYSQAIPAIVPAASATDFACLQGSSTKNVHITRIEVSGTATTLITTAINLIRRNTLDTGTVSTVPLAATGMTFTNPAASATLVAYDSTSGNPTLTDTTSHQGIRYAKMTFALSGTSAMPADRLVWSFGTNVEAYDQHVNILKGSTQEICLNLGAVSVTAGSVVASFEWTED